MLTRFNLIREEMERIEEHWNWSFMYASLPGRSRVKVTVRSKANATEGKVMFVSAAVFERLPTESITQLLTILFHAEPTTTLEPVPVSAPPRVQNTYEMLRELYRAKVEDLRNQPARGVTMIARKKGLTSLFTRKEPNR